MIKNFGKYLNKNSNFILRFILVGCVTFCLNICLTWVFYDGLNIDYKIAISIAYGFTVVMHFSLNKFFTFNSAKHSIVNDGIRYALMLLVNYLVTLVLSIIFVGMFGLSPYLSIMISTIVIASSSFLLMRHLIFHMQGKAR